MKSFELHQPHSTVYRVFPINMGMKKVFDFQFYRYKEGRPHFGKLKTPKRK